MHAGQRHRIALRQHSTASAQQKPTDPLRQMAKVWAGNPQALPYRVCRPACRRGQKGERRGHLKRRVHLAQERTTLVCRVHVERGERIAQVLHDNSSHLLLRLLALY